ncbi:hypothetical protein AB0J83_01225 [Actinoplanes sp. NPDC049596]|uniref:hypothetical protein n=1 Tax=unclassified Actinoplanes TaxID=2626549 RepID=UPI003427B2D3
MSVGKPPGLGWVIVGTAVIGALGAFIALSKAKKAAAVGVSSTRYWVAFGVTLGVTWLVGVIVSVLAFVNASDPITPQWLQEPIVAQAKVTNDDGKVLKATDATRVAASVDSQGAGAYQCLVDFEGGVQGSYRITVDSDGRWVTAPGD